MPKYRVECVNPVDGITVVHTLAANNTGEAKELAIRMGYVVGAATEDVAPPVDIQRAITGALDTQRRKQSASSLVNVMIVFAVIGVLAVLRFAYTVLHPD